jgi:pyruvate dehydrogenase E2 component (dihydrolipoamide acetyltransferase)
MATEIKLPRLGQGMESGTIVKWLKSEGESVEKGEPLYELDTDKVTQEVEADASGVLLKIAVPEGEVEVGRTIAVLGEAGEEVTQLEEPKVDETEQEEGSRGPAREEERERGRQASPDAVTEVQEPAAEPPARAGGPVEGAHGNREVSAGSADGQGRIKASPLARRIARERGLDLTAIAGTGPEGRVVAEDVERAAASPQPLAPPGEAPRVAPPREVESIPVTSIQRTVARRMTEAWQIPVFHLFVSADMSRANEVRKRLVELTPEGGVKPTVSDLLTKLCGAALMRHRALNAWWAEDAIELHPSANIGLAVALPAGLVVPVIRECERKSVAEIAAVRADLVTRAREGKLQREDLEGGTFTISNLGMYGVERFTAVLNPPQAAIVAVGATQEKPVVRDGELAVRPMMDLMLTCDHRAVNGADGAGFLQTVKEILEEPALAL